MTFSDYVLILKKNFKVPIAQDNLCRIIFDSVITTAKLTKTDGNYLDFDTADISKILNRQKNIPTEIQSHAFDEKIFQAIHDYFQQNIVAELIPDLFEDLCHQMMSLLEIDNDISSAHKKRLRLLAKPESITEFLVDIFKYVIRKDNKLPVSTTSNLKILGIDDNNALTKTFILPRFRLKLEYTLPEYEIIIQKLFERIAEYSDFETSKNFSQIYNFPPYPDWIEKAKKITIPDSDKILVQEFAQKFNFKLPADFFELGDLKENTFPLNLQNSKFIGDEIWQQKYEEISNLIDALKNYIKLKPIDSHFQNIFALRLALKNNSKQFEENILVKLFIDSDSLFSVQKLDVPLQQSLLTEFEDSFYIEGSDNFLSYYSKNKSHALPFISFLNSNCDLTAEWNKIFSYKVHQKSSTAVLEISFERMNPNSVIAFPNVILLKKIVRAIKFEIYSQSNFTSGQIKFKN